MARSAAQPSGCVRSRTAISLRGMPSRDTDERFMRAALLEAQRGLGLTSPNPAVGAALAIDEKIVARGHHRRAGAPHAEAECLAHFGRKVPKSATLYVT